MKQLRKRLIVTIPTLFAVAATIFICVDTLTVHSTVAPASTPSTSYENTVSSSEQPSPTSTPHPQSTVQVSPASPTPKVTVASTRAGNLLTIPAIGLNASVINVGTTADNAIDVPAGPQVGFWTGSAVPGMTGATFLDGHVDGIFAHLHKLTVGQEFSLRFNGQTFRYQVAHTETVALEGIDMKKALSTYSGAVEGLNMMTCAGTFMPSMNTYDQRFVVYAVRIG